MSEKKPNILLIMTDQMRGDCMGCAGHPDVKTPHLDTLAARGVLYPNAYSACPSCVAARAALHTGRSPRGTGRVGYQDGVDWSYPHTLAGELAQGGYYTKCVGKQHVHPLRNRIGFHHVELHDGYLGHYRRSSMPACEYQPLADDYFHWLKNEHGMETDVTDTGIGVNAWTARPWIYDEACHPTNWVTTRCLDFLRTRDRSEPFFLMASYVRPHPPFDAPGAYFDMYRDLSLRAPAHGDWSASAVHTIGPGGGRIHDADSAPDDPELIRQAQIGYYACITHLDHQIGRLLYALEEQELSGETLIVFTSDHGELLCDHGLFRKARAYQGSIQIPLIVSGAIGEADRGTRDHRVAELRDILPTLLTQAGRPIPETVEGLDLFAPPQRAFLHGEHSFGAASNHYIVTQRDKYVWYSHSGAERYFDLAADPREEHDRIGDGAYSERVSVLRAQLIRALAGREEGYTDGERLIAGRAPQSVLAFPRAE